jgi:hypothetical protein
VVEIEADEHPWRLVEHTYIVADAEALSKENIEVRRNPPAKPVYKLRRAICSNAAYPSSI